MTELQAAIAELMHKNQREVEGYLHTVPSPELYPFQWLWDSCFHSHIYASLGEHEAAMRELTSLCAKPMPSGLLPHIIYWEPLPPEMKWGREQRSDIIDNAWGIEETSAITQPPIIARTLLSIFQQTGDRVWLDSLRPVVERYFAALKTERQYDDTELLFIINPDESGEDNSPRFDQAIGLPAHHTADEHLSSRISLMLQQVDCKFDAKLCMRKHFAIIDVGFNVLYYDGLIALSEIAELVEDHETAEYYRTTALRLQHDMQTHLVHNDRYQAYDMVQEKHLEVSTWHLFMPLYAGLVSQEEAKHLVSLLFDRELFMSPHGIRTTAATEPSYDPDKGFWRGPIWAAPYWFIIHGLIRYGFTQEAAELKKQLERLVTEHGLREHYHPETGVGLGALDFTWSGLAITLPE